MLYFFHHYELPVILQQAQLQQLLLRTHRGMGMMGLAGIAALASGAAYHDAPGTGTGTGTQATPPTTQSTTQTIQNTVQSTTQTSPSVSTVQTNTTHTGDVISSRSTATETHATGTNTVSSIDSEEAPASPMLDNRNDKDASAVGDNGIRIEEIARLNSKSNVRDSSNGQATGASLDNNQIDVPSGAHDVDVSASSGPVETLDRRRNKCVGIEQGDPPNLPDLTTADRLAPRASPEVDDLD